MLQPPLLTGTEPRHALLERYFEAFRARDGAAMEACYHPAARFSDPVFPVLSAAEVGAMWRMLTHRAQELHVEYELVEASEASGQALWSARYRYGRRLVVNRVASRFLLQDGLILEQTDSFDFARWARQALGPAGWLLGGTGFLRRRVQAQARAALARFMAREQG